MIKKYRHGIIVTLNNGRRAYVRPDTTLDNGDFLGEYYSKGKLTGTKVVSNIEFTKEGADAVKQALAEVPQL